MKPFFTVIGLAASLATAPALFAQELPAKGDPAKDAAPSLIPADAAPAGYVSREEYDALLLRVLDLEKRLGGAETKTAETETKIAAREKEVDESLDAMEKKSGEIQKLADATRAGTTKFLLTGYGTAGFEDRPGESGKFTAGFSPILLWKISDRLFFESELEIELTAAETDVHLEYANLSYLLNNYVTVKAGKFLTPFGTFADRLHAAWINKLPDQPLAVGEEGIAPFAQTGVQLSGGFTLGPTKLNYALYAVNGPRLNRDADNLAELGTLAFDNFTETNSRSYGGRIGFLPIPELEVGYSFQSVTGPVSARLQAVDLTYTREFDWLHGTLDLRGQWVWSDAGNFRFLPEVEEGAQPRPITFANRRDGGYIQLAYRPTKAKNDIAKRFEILCRYDRLSLPAAVRLGDDPERCTIGLNYWLGPSTVVKAAYQFNLSDTDGNGGRDGNAILFQASMGF